VASYAYTHPLDKGVRPVEKDDAALTAWYYHSTVADIDRIDRCGFVIDDCFPARIVRVLQNEKLACVGKIINIYF